MNHKHINARIPKELYTSARILAVKEDVNFSEIVRRALTYYIELPWGYRELEKASVSAPKPEHESPVKPDTSNSH